MARSTRTKTLTHHRVDVVVPLGGHLLVVLHLVLVVVLLPLVLVLVVVVLPLVGLLA